MLIYWNLHTVIIIYHIGAIFKGFGKFILKFLFTHEITPHAERRISHCAAIFHARSAFRKSEGFISLKKAPAMQALFSNTPDRNRTDD